jgi:hypothetical protein
MRALGIAFSARRRANCYDCVSFCLESLRDEGFSTDIIDMFDYTIEPCSHCEYECLAEYIRGVEEACPKNDDAREIYRRLEAADAVVMGVPPYCGQPPALFRIFQERSLGIYRYGNRARILESKAFGFIVLRDHFTLEAATRLYSRYGHTYWVSLHPFEFGGLMDINRAMTMKLVDIPEARTKLRALAGLLAADVRKAAHQPGDE